MALSTNLVASWRIGAAAALSAAFVYLPAARADTQIGNAAQVVNSVTGTLASTRQTEVLRAGIDVFQNEMIDTAAASASRVIFADRTQLSIGPASRVVLDRFVFDPNPSASAVAVSLAKGVARFSTGLLPKPDYQITTPSCVIGVRGTVLTAIVSAERNSWVSVEEGAASVSAQGVTVIVNAGQTTYVAFGQPPTPPTASTAPPPILTQMDALLQTGVPAAPPLGPPPGGPGPYAPPPGGGYYGPVPGFGGGFGGGGNFGGDGGNRGGDTGGYTGGGGFRPR